MRLEGTDAGEAVAEEEIDEDERHHRLGDGDGAEADAGVVTAPRRNFGGPSLGVDRLLFDGDG